MSPRAVVSFTFFFAITAAAALSRLTLTGTESRKHILAFWILAVTVEAVIKPRLRVRPSLWLALLTGACATGAIVFVRWHLEGLCPHTWPQCPHPIYAARKSWGF
jgi:hypothetical protein